MFQFINPSTRVDRIWVDLNFKPLLFSTGVIYSQIFCDMDPLDINVLDSRI